MIEQNTPQPKGQEVLNFSKASAYSMDIGLIDSGFRKMLSENPNTYLERGTVDDFKQSILELNPNINLSDEEIQKEYDTKVVPLYSYYTHLKNADKNLRLNPRGGFQSAVGHFAGDKDYVQRVNPITDDIQFRDVTLAGTSELEKRKPLLTEQEAGHLLNVGVTLNNNMIPLEKIQNNQNYRLVFDKIPTGEMAWHYKETPEGTYIPKNMSYSPFMDKLFGVQSLDASWYSAPVKALLEGIIGMNMGAGGALLSLVGHGYDMITREKEEFDINKPLSFDQFSSITNESYSSNALTKAGNSLSNWGNMMSRSAKNEQEGFFESVDNAWYSVWNGIGQISGMIGVGSVVNKGMYAVNRGATGSLKMLSKANFNQKVAMQASLITGGFQAAGAMKDQMIQEGIDPDIAHVWGALAFGIGTYLSENIMGANVLYRFGAPGAINKELKEMVKDIPNDVLAKHGPHYNALKGASKRMYDTSQMNKINKLRYWTLDKWEKGGVLTKGLMAGLEEGSEEYAEGILHAGVEYLINSHAKTQAKEIKSRYKDWEYKSESINNIPEYYRVNNKGERVYMDYNVWSAEQSDLDTANRWLSGELPFDISLNNMDEATSAFISSFLVGLVRGGGVGSIFNKKNKKNENTQKFGLQLLSVDIATGKKKMEDVYKELNDLQLKSRVFGEDMTIANETIQAVMDQIGINVNIIKNADMVNPEILHELAGGGTSYISKFFKVHADIQAFEEAIKNAGDTNIVAPITDVTTKEITVEEATKRLEALKEKQKDFLPEHPDKGKKTSKEYTNSILESQLPIEIMKYQAIKSLKIENKNYDELSETEKESVDKLTRKLLLNYQSGSIITMTIKSLLQNYNVLSDGPFESFKRLMNETYIDGNGKTNGGIWKKAITSVINLHNQKIEENKKIQSEKLRTNIQKAEGKLKDISENKKGLNTQQIYLEVDDIINTINKTISESEGLLTAEDSKEIGARLFGGTIEQEGSPIKLEGITNALTNILSGQQSNIQAELEATKKEYGEDSQEYISSQAELESYGKFKNISDLSTEYAEIINENIFFDSNKTYNDVNYQGQPLRNHIINQAISNMFEFDEVSQNSSITNALDYLRDIKDSLDSGITEEQQNTTKLLLDQISSTIEVLDNMYKMNYDFFNEKTGIHNNKSEHNYFKYKDNGLQLDKNTYDVVKNFLNEAKALIDELINDERISQFDRTNRQLAMDMSNVLLEYHTISLMRMKGIFTNKTKINNAIQELDEYLESLYKKSDKGVNKNFIEELESNDEKEFFDKLFEAITDIEIGDSEESNNTIALKKQNYKEVFYQIVKRKNNILNQLGGQLDGFIEYVNKASEQTQKLCKTYSLKLENNADYLKSIPFAQAATGILTEVNGALGYREIMLLQGMIDNIEDGQKAEINSITGEKLATYFRNILTFAQKYNRLGVNGAPTYNQILSEIYNMRQDDKQIFDELYENNNLEEINKMAIVTSEQEQQIIHVVGFLFNTNQEGIKKLFSNKKTFKNTLNLRGYAAAGKTTEVLINSIQLYNRIIKNVKDKNGNPLKKLQYTVVAPQASLLTTHLNNKEQLGYDDKMSEHLTLSEYMSKGSRATSTLVIFDEVSVYDAETILQLKNITDKENKINIMISDDHQTSGSKKSTSMVLPSSNYMVEKTIPLTEMFRSGDTAIHGLNDQMRTFYQTKKESTVFIPRYNLKKDSVTGKLRGIILSKDRNDLLNKFLENKNDFSDSMYIVIDMEDYEYITKEIRQDTSLSETQKQQALNKVFTLEFTNSNPDLLVSGLSSDNVYLDFDFKKRPFGTMEGGISNIDNMRLALTGSQRVKKSLHLIDASINNELYIEQQDKINNNTNIPLFKEPNIDRILEVEKSLIITLNRLDKTLNEDDSNKNQIDLQRIMRINPISINDDIVNSKKIKAHIQNQKVDKSKDRENTILTILDNIINNKENTGLLSLVFDEKEFTTENKKSKLEKSIVRFLITSVLGDVNVSENATEINVRNYQVNASVLQKIRAIIDIYNKENPTTIIKNENDSYIRGILNTFYGSSLYRALTKTKDLNNRFIVNPIIELDGNIQGMPLGYEIIGESKEGIIVDLHDINILYGDTIVEASEYTQKKLMAYALALAKQGIYVRNYVVNHVHKNGSDVSNIRQEELGYEDIQQFEKEIKEKLKIKESLKTENEVLSSIYEKQTLLDKKIVKRSGLSRLNKLHVLNTEQGKELVVPTEYYIKTTDGVAKLYIRYTQNNEKIISLYEDFVNNAVEYDTKKNQLFAQLGKVYKATNGITSRFTFGSNLLNNITGNIDAKDIWKIGKDNELQKAYSFLNEALGILNIEDNLDISFEKEALVLTPSNKNGKKNYNEYSVTNSNNVFYIRMSDEFIKKNKDKLIKIGKKVYGKDFNIDTIKDKGLDVLTSLKNIEAGYDKNFNNDFHTNAVIRLLQDNTEKTINDIKQEIRDRFENSSVENDIFIEENIKLNQDIVDVVSNVLLGNNKTTVNSLSSGHIVFGDDITVSELENNLRDSGYELEQRKGQLKIRTFPNKYGTKAQHITAIHKFTKEKIDIEVFADKLNDKNKRKEYIDDLINSNQWKEIKENMKKLDNENLSNEEMSKIVKSFFDSDVFLFIENNASILLNQNTNDKDLNKQGSIFSTYIISEGQINISSPKLSEKVKTAEKILNLIKADNFIINAEEVIRKNSYTKGEKVENTAKDYDDYADKTTLITNVNNVNAPHIRINKDNKQNNDNLNNEEQGNSNMFDDESDMLSNENDLENFTITEQELRLQLRTILGSYADTFTNLELIFTKDKGLAGRLINKLLEFYSYNGKYHKYVGRHEAMHFIVKHLLTAEQRNEIYEDAKKELGAKWDGTLTHLDEYISIKFETYKAKKDPTTLLGKFIEWFKDLIGINKITALQNLLYKADKGDFANAQIVDDSNVVLEKRISNGLTSPAMQRTLMSKFDNISVIKMVQTRYLLHEILFNSEYSRGWNKTNREPLQEAMKNVLASYKEWYSENRDITNYYIKDNEGNKKPLSNWTIQDVLYAREQYQMASNFSKAGEVLQQYSKAQLANSAIYKAMLQRMLPNTNIPKIFSVNNEVVDSSVSDTNAYSENATNVSMDNKTSDIVKMLLNNVPLQKIKRDENGKLIGFQMANYIPTRYLMEMLDKIMERVKQSYDISEVTWETFEAEIGRTINELTNKNNKLDASYLSSFIGYFGSLPYGYNITSNKRNDGSFLEQTPVGYGRMLQEAKEGNRPYVDMEAIANIRSLILNYFKSQSFREVIDFEVENDKVKVIKRTGAVNIGMKVKIKNTIFSNIFDENKELNNNISKTIKELGFEINISTDGKVDCKFPSSKNPVVVESLKKGEYTKDIYELVRYTLGIELHSDVIEKLKAPYTYKKVSQSQLSTFHGLNALMAYIYRASLGSNWHNGINNNTKEGFKNALREAGLSKNWIKLENTYALFDLLAKYSSEANALISSNLVINESGKTSYLKTYTSKANNLKNKIIVLTDESSSGHTTALSKYSNTILKYNNLLNKNLFIDVRYIGYLNEMFNKNKAIKTDELTQKDFLNLLINHLIPSKIDTTVNNELVLPLEMFADKPDIMVMAVSTKSQFFDGTKINNYSAITSLFDNIFNYYNEKRTIGREKLTQKLETINSILETKGLSKIDIVQFIDNQSEIELTKEQADVIRANTIKTREIKLSEIVNEEKIVNDKNEEKSKYTYTYIAKAGNIITEENNIYNEGNYNSYIDKTPEQKYEFIVNMFSDDIRYLNSSLNLNNIKLKRFANTPYLEVVTLLYNVLNESINQLEIGDINNYVSVSDSLKRRAGFSAPGSVLDITNEFGIGKRSRFVTFRDISGYFSQYNIDKAKRNNLVTDGLTIVSSVYRHLLNNSAGGKLSVLGQSSVKTVIDDYNEISDERTYLKHSMFHATQDDYTESNTFMMKAERFMLGDNLYNELLILMETMPYQEAVKRLANKIITENRRDEIIDMITFESAFKSTPRNILDFDLKDTNGKYTFDNVLFPTRDEVVNQIQSFDNSKMLHQSVSSNINEVESKNIVVQIISLIQSGEQNKNIAEKLGRSRAEIADIGKELINDLLNIKDVNELKKRLANLFKQNDKDPLGIEMLKATNSLIDLQALAVSHIENIIKDIQKYVHIKMDGLTATLKPSLSNYYIDENGVFYTEDDIARIGGVKKNMTVGRLRWWHLTYKGTRELYKGNITNESIRKLDVAPAQVAMPFLTRKDYGVGDNVTAAQLMNILIGKNELNLNLDHLGKIQLRNKYKDNTSDIYSLYKKQLTEFLTDNVFSNDKLSEKISLQEFKEIELIMNDKSMIMALMNKYIKNKTSEQKTQLREYNNGNSQIVDFTREQFVDAISSYYFDINKDLDVMIVAIPTNNPATATYGRIVVFKNNQGNTIEYDATSAEEHSKDHDFDNFHVFVRPKKSNKKGKSKLNTKIEEAKLEIFESMVSYYTNRDNTMSILSKINTSNAKSKLVEKEKQILSNESSDTDVVNIIVPHINTPANLISQFKIQYQGKNLVGHMANMLTFSNSAKGLTNKTGFNQKLKYLFDDKYIRDIQDTISTLVQLATDNANMNGILGQLNINEYVTPFILGYIMAYDGNINELETSLYDMLLNDTMLIDAINKTYYGSTSLVKNKTLLRYFNSYKPINNNEAAKVEKYKEYIFIGTQMKNLGSIFQLISGTKNKIDEIERIVKDIEVFLGTNIKDFLENRNKYKSYSPQSQIDYLEKHNIIKQNDDVELQKRELINIAELVANNDYLFSYVDLLHSALDGINKSFDIRTKELRDKIHSYFNFKLNIDKQTTEVINNDFKSEENTQDVQKENNDTNTIDEESNEVKNENEYNSLPEPEMSFNNQNFIARLNNGINNLFYSLSVKHAYSGVNSIKINGVKIGESMYDFNFDLSNEESALNLIYLAPYIHNHIKETINSSELIKKAKNEFLAKIHSINDSRYLSLLEMTGSKYFTEEYLIQLNRDFKVIEEHFPEFADFYYAYHTLVYGLATNNGTFRKFMGDKLEILYTENKENVLNDIANNLEKYADNIVVKEGLTTRSPKNKIYQSGYNLRVLDGTKKNDESLDGRKYTVYGSIIEMKQMQKLNANIYPTSITKNKVLKQLSHKELIQIMLGNESVEINNTEIMNKLHADKIKIDEAIKNKKEPKDYLINTDNPFFLRTGTEVRVSPTWNGIVVNKVINNLSSSISKRNTLNTMKNKASAKAVQVLSNLITKNNSNLNIKIEIEDNLDSYGDVTVVDNNIVIRLNSKQYNLETPLHELGHVVYAILRITNPTLYLKLKEEAIALINNNDVFVQDIVNSMGNRANNMEEVIEEIVVQLAGMSSAQKVENYFALRGMDNSKSFWNKIKIIANKIAKTISNFFFGKANINTSIQQLSEMIYKSAINGNQFNLNEEQIEELYEILKTSAKKQTIKKAETAEQFIELLTNPVNIPGVQNITEDIKIQKIIDTIKTTPNIMIRNASGEAVNFNYSKDEFNMSNTKLVQDIREIFFSNNLPNNIVAENIRKLFNMNKPLTNDLSISVFGNSKYDDNAPLVNKNTLSKIGVIIGHSSQVKQGREYIAYKDLKNHKELSYLYDEALDGINPTLCISKNSKTGEYYISIYDITNNPIAKLSDGLSKKQKNIMGLYKLKSDIGLTNMYGDMSILNMIMIANHLGDAKNINILDMGIVQFFPSSNEVRAHIFDKVRYMKEIEKLLKEDIITEKMSEKIINLLSKTHYINTDVDYKKMLFHFWRNSRDDDSIENRSIKRYLKKLDVDENNLTREDELAIYRFRMKQISKITEPDELDIKEMELLEATYKMLTTITIDAKQMNTKEDIGFAKKMASPSGYIFNDDVQHLIGESKKAAFEVSKSLDDFKRGKNKKYGKSFNEFVDFFMKRNGSSVALLDQGGKVFNELFAKIEADQNGVKVMKNSGYILWTTDKTLDPLFADQAKLLDKEVLEWGKWLVDVITDTYAEQLYHAQTQINDEIKENGVWKKYTMADAYYELGVVPPVEIDSNPDSKKINRKTIYRKGMLPLMRSTVSERIAKGKIGSSIKQRWSQLSDSYALFEDIATLNDSEVELLDHMPNIFMGQLGIGVNVDNVNKLGVNKIVRDMLGLNIVGDKVIVEDSHLNDNMSQDLEILMGYFLLTSKRKIEYENRVVPVMNAVKFNMKIDSDYKGVANEQLKDYMKLFFTNSVLGKRIKIDSKIDPIIRTTMSATSFSMLAYSLTVATVSLAHNVMVGFNESIANYLADNGMYNTQDIIKATGLVLSEPGKTLDIMRNIQMMSMDEYEMVKHRINTKTKGHITSDFLTNVMNWGVDYFAKGVVMTAQMLHDGTYDAFVKKENEYVYDYKKDKQFSEPGKQRTKKDEALLKAKREYLYLEDNVIGHEDGIGITRPYIMKEINRFKFISNKLTGAFSALEKDMMGTYSITALGKMFKTFALVKFQEAFSKEGFMDSGRIVVEKTSDGEYIGKYVRDEFVGYISYSAKYILNGLKNKRLDWKTLPSHKKYALAKMAMTMATYIFCIAMYNMFVLRKDKKFKDFGPEEWKLIKEKKLFAQFRYAAESLLVFPLIFDFASGKTFPAFSILANGFSGVLDMDLSTLKVLIPARGTINTISELITDDYIL